METFAWGEEVWALFVKLWNKVKEGDNRAVGEFAAFIACDDLTVASAVGNGTEQWSVKL